MKNRVYRLDWLCFSIWKTMFFRNSAFYSINWVFRDKLCFSSKKTMFFHRKTLFIGDKQCFLIYYTSGLPYALINSVYCRKTMFLIKKQSLSVDKQCLSNRKAEFFDKLCFLIEKHSFSKTMFFVEKPCLSTWLTMFFDLKNYVFQKLCFLLDKLSFSR